MKVKKLELLKKGYSPAYVIKKHGKCPTIKEWRDDYEGWKNRTWKTQRKWF